MNKAIIYIILAIFLALVVQPNISVSPKKSASVPTNTDSEAAIMTNDSVDLETCKSKAVICIDPAYGGSDTGYSEDEKTPAKDITLDLSLQIGEKLAQSGYQVVYTREDDNIETSASSDVDANNRINKAMDQKADYFISVGVNSDDSPLTKGYTIFTQNNQDLIKLGSSISENLQSINYSKNDGLDSDHYGNFPILQNDNIPTIYIEFGYLTNQQDYSQLTDEEYQTKIAESIAKSFLETIN